MDGSSTEKTDVKSSEAEIIRDVLQDSSRGDLWRIISFLKPFKWQFLTLLLIVVVINITQLIRPMVIGKAINSLSRIEGTAPDKQQIWDYVIWPTGIYFVSGVLFALMLGYRPRATMKLSAAMLRHLRMLVYARIQRLSFDHLDRLTTGQLIERAIGDVNAIRMFLTGSFVGIFDAAVTVVLMLSLMMTMDVKLTLIFVAPVPVVVFLFGKINIRIRRWSRRTRDAVDTMTSQLTESIEGVKVVRSFAAEPMMSENYNRTLQTIFRRAMRVGKVQSFGLLGMFHSARLVQVIVVAIGGAAVINGRLEVGYFITYLFYVRMLIHKVQPIMDAAASSQEARAAFERIAALVDVGDLIEDDHHSRDLPEGGGHLRFNNVSFAYQPSPDHESDVTERMQIVRPSPSPPTLRNIDLDVPPGCIVALIGPTGSGKTTLVNLLPRFYDPTAGSIELDGCNLRNIKLAQLRNNVGFVFQETFLFKGTIAENIAFGCEDYTMADVKRAARMAQADTFIQELSAGYDARIGERGVSLSGGQRQRIAIARAILMNPRVLVLDDATASVDPTTEYHIRRGLKELMTGRTTIIIAHRLATIRAADKIVVMNDGAIEAIGDHEHLSQTNQFYKDLLETQSMLQSGEINGELPGGEQ